MGRVKSKYIKFMILILGVISILFIISISQAQERIRAVFPRYFPPQFRLDEQGRPQGFAIDVMNMVAAEAGVEMEYIPLPTWADVNEAIDKGEADLVPNMGISPTREHRYDFTKPTETFRIVLFVRSTTDDIKSVSDLDGRRVAVVKTNLGNRLMKKRSRVNRVIYRDMAQAFFDLIAGYVDAFVYPEPPILNLALDAGLEGRIKIIDGPLREVKRGIAVAKGRPELVARLDAAVAKVTATPQYQALYSKWFGSPQPFWTAKRSFLATAGGALLLIIALIAWRFITTTRLNRRLKRSEAEYRSLAENTHEIISRIDKNYRYLYLNRPPATIAGYEVERFIGQTYREMGGSERISRFMEEMIDKVVADRRPHSSLIEIEDNGKQKVIDWLVLPEQGDGGQVDSVLAVGRDVSALVQAEQKKRELEEQLGQKMKMEAIGRLAGGIAHDFNNLLSAIIGFAELAKEDSAGNFQLGQDLEKILQAGWRARDLTGQLLAFSRKQVLDLNPVSLNEVVSHTQNILLRLLGEDVAISTRLADSMPAVMADFNQLEQIFINLSVNSRDAMPDGGQLIIETGVQHLDQEYTQSQGELEPGEYAFLAISDTGQGMDAEVLGKAFEPFYTTKPKGKGTGLGLSTIHGIVKQHRGHVTIYSEPGQGTTVRVYLPVTESESISPAEAIPAGEILGGSETLLVVEDDEMVRSFAVNSLQRLGYRILESANPRQAIDLFEQGKPQIDLVITDVIMPVMSGKALYEELSRFRPELPVIFMSGYTDDVIAHHGVLDPGVNFLTKPFSRDQLAAKVRSVLDAA